MSELIRGVAHSIDQLKVFVVIELTISLEIRCLANSIFHLFVAGSQAKFFSILVEQHIVDQLAKYLLTQLQHVTFIRGQRGELFAQLLLQAATFALYSLF
ncbi:Uncharacterised protein [Yersinia enterocolitica]|nr:Uncharacterised protein [Yersinia enterocolitica]